jgi:high-affinity iron transporter
VWFGVALGVAVCVIIGAGMIGAFYGIGIDTFSKTEDLWEGVFSLIATIVITLVGGALLRVSKLQDKWRVKLANALEGQDIKHHTKGSGNRFKLWCQKYAMFILPLITVMREGLEAVIFIGGVGLGLPASSFPLAVFCGLLAGIAVGYLIYRYVDPSL